MPLIHITDKPNNMNYILKCNRCGHWYPSKDYYLLNESVCNECRGKGITESKPIINTEEHIVISKIK